MGEVLNGFERLLGNDGSPWFEHDLELAGEALNEFSSAEWRNLQSRVLSSSAWVTLTFMLSKYDALLSGVREYDNYWSDVAITDAIAFLETFLGEDWAALGIMAEERPRLWQSACAQTLSEATNTACSVDLLLGLLRVGDDDVTVAVLDSINALTSSGLDVSVHATQLRSAIAQARANAGAAASCMLDALDEKLSPA